jgi:hypothetical protein
LKLLDRLLKRPRLRPETILHIEKPFLEFFEECADHAVDSTLRFGGHVAMLYVCRGNELALYVLDGFLDRGDEGRLALIKALWKRYAGRADWFVNLTESWHAPDYTAARPSLHPDRRNVFEIRGVGQDGVRARRSYEMRRDESGRVIGLERLDLGQDSELLLESPLFGRKFDWLADLFDPTNA